MRSFLILCICSVVARVGKVSPFWGHRENLRLLLLRGVSGAAFVHCFYQAIALLPLSDAVTFYFLSPALTAVVAWALLKEKLSIVVGFLEWFHSSRESKPLTFHLDNHYHLFYPLKIHLLTRVPLEWLSPCSDLCC